jgi:hypothetical protein
MALSITRKGSIASGRSKLLDIPLNSSYNITLITLSCGGSDPIWEIYLDKDINDLAQPTAPSLTVATTGGGLPRNKKVFVRISTVDSNGIEGPLSDGANFKITGSSTDTNKVTASWSSISGAESYNVYVSYEPGQEMFIANTSGTSYIITENPPSFDLSKQPIGLCDIHVIGKKGGVEPIPLAGGGLQIGYRIIVYVTVGASATPSFSLLAQ